MENIPPRQDAVHFPQTKYQVGVKEHQSRPDFHTAGLLEAVTLYQKEAKDRESVETSKEGGSQSRAGAGSGVGRARGTDKGRR